MEKMVTRSVPFLSVKATRVWEENGKIKTEDVLEEMSGITEKNTKKISQILSEHYPLSSFLKIEVKKEMKVYGVPVGKFMELAVEVKRPPSQSKNNQKEN